MAFASRTLLACVSFLFVLSLGANGHAAGVRGDAKKSEQQDAVMEKSEQDIAETAEMLTKAGTALSKTGNDLGASGNAASAEAIRAMGAAIRAMGEALNATSSVLTTPPVPAPIPGSASVSASTAVTAPTLVPNSVETPKKDPSSNASHSSPFAELPVPAASSIFPASTSETGIHDGQSALAWQANASYSASAPEKFLLVDKSLQRMSIFEKDVPPVAALRYGCSTGQLTGDKIVRNDKRTPEGVYFVEKRIPYKLDKVRYGGIGFALNYPNPVDKLRKKTGHGIWIHGRGYRLPPQDTSGCVALNLAQIQELVPLLHPNLPVVIADSVQYPDSAAQKAQALPAEAVSNKLVELSKEWNDAWQSRSPNFFKFYDAESYTASKSGEFTAFRQQKERIFCGEPWIHITQGDVAVLQGTGYWVSFFPQLYRSSRLTNQGTRRLYWMPNEQGEFHIVGMEWNDEQVTADMKARYLSAYTQRIWEFLSKEKPEIAALSDAERQAWRIDMRRYGFVVVSPAGERIKIMPNDKGWKIGQ